MRTFALNPLFFYAMQKDRRANFQNSCNCNDSLMDFRIDIFEKDENIFIVVELPGMEKENIAITINEKNTLSIKGSKKNSCECNDNCNDNNVKYFLQERSFGDFHRQFVLPDHIDTENISADYKNGELIIKLIKKPNTTGNNIEVPIN